MRNIYLIIIEVRNTIESFDHNANISINTNAIFEHDPGFMNRIHALTTRYDFDPQFIMMIENINPEFYHVMSK